jgi:feruloyl esterase
VNATGNGASRWKSLSYADLANAADRGLALQGPFANIDTDNPDLSKFRDRGGKLITVYGLSDNLIFHQGFLNYYNRVANQMGGLAAVQAFYKVYMVPGLGHFPINGTANPSANPPLPSEDQNYANLTRWVEQGVAPDRIEISSPVTPANPVASTLPLCVYPKKATYTSGDIHQAGSYVCS